MKLYTANIEKGMPTVAQARIRLDQALRTARSQRYTVLKIIHGYGSSGKGGAIKKDVHIVLQEQKKQGRVRYFVSGENFSPFDAETRSILDTYPVLRKDKDYSRGNAGVTIVVL